MSHSRVFTILAVLSTIIFTECSKSADPAAPSLVGTWLATSGSTIGCTDATLNSPEASCLTNCQTLVLTTSTWTSSYPGSSVTTGPYAAAGGSFTFTGVSGSPTATETWTYTLTATTLTMTFYANGSGCTYVSKYTRQ